MSLRLAAAAALILLLTVQGAALAQGSGGSLPKMTSVREQLPWFDQSGVSFGYTLQGVTSSQGGESYMGTASVNVLGVSPNDSVKIETAATTGNPIFPNGTLYDDPFFPSYIQVLPVAFVIPDTFAILAPTYGLSFTYLGTVQGIYHGARVSAYAYSASASGAGQGGSQLVKYYRVLPSNGVILDEELTNTQTGATLNVTLSSLTLPSVSTTLTPLQFDSADFSAPGSFITYRNTGAANQSITYSSLFTEPDGVFVYEREVSANGSLTGTQFYVDESSNPQFYPASSSKAEVITFPVAVGSLESGVLTKQGAATVKTLDGYFYAQAYANTTLGFEAYLDNSTGVAVFLELPGGDLQLYASNFLTPGPSPNKTAWLLDVIPVAIVVAVALLLVLHYRKPSPKRRKR
jgi:hypothetical protein